LLGFTCESNEKGKMLPYGFVDSEYGGWVFGNGHPMRLSSAASLCLSGSWLPF
jgi:hypothetical protein